MIGQSRTWSLTESIVNVVVGYLIAVLSQWVIFSALDLPVPLRLQLWIAGWFTAVSLMRTYVLRRLFNRMGD